MSHSRDPHSHVPKARRTKFDGGRKDAARRQRSSQMYYFCCHESRRFKNKNTSIRRMWTLLIPPVLAKIQNRPEMARRNTRMKYSQEQRRSSRRSSQLHYKLVRRTAVPPPSVGSKGGSRNDTRARKFE
jgi:hypothetical protein